MKRRILVVDDEPTIVNIVTKALAADGIELVGFNKSSDVLEYAQSYDVDVLISDFVMPGLQGNSLCAELKKIDPTIQCVVITGYPTEELFDSLLSIGITDVYIKPFDFVQLKNAALRACDRSQNLKHISKMWRTEKK
jgi:DNA-binding NtrC family response regulator